MTVTIAVMMFGVVGTASLSLGPVSPEVVKIMPMAAGTYLPGSMISDAKPVAGELSSQVTSSLTVKSRIPVLVSKTN